MSATNIVTISAFFCLIIGYLAGVIVGRREKRKEIVRGIDNLLESGKIKIFEREEEP